MTGSGDQVRDDPHDDLHARLYVADAHNDLLMSVAPRPREDWRSTFTERWLPQLRAGGVDLQLLAVCLDPSLPVEAALRRTLVMLEAAAVIGETDGVRLTDDAAAMERARDRGELVLVPALEGCTAIGTDLSLLSVMRRFGVRVASLVHVGRNALADSSTEDDAGGRLTRAGVEAVAEMERLGITLDVSHLSRAGVDHLLEIASRPVMATHSAARALRDHHRNLDDGQLRAVAASGGVVCVNAFGPFLTAGRPTIADLVRHVEHVVEIVGIDAVGIGPDFVRDVLADVLPGWEDPDRADSIGVTSSYVPGLEGPAGLPLLTRALLDSGWREADVRSVMGENLYRFLRAACVDDEPLASCTPR